MTIHDSRPGPISTGSACDPPKANREGPHRDGSQRTSPFGRDRVQPLEGPAIARPAAADETGGPPQEVSLRIVERIQAGTYERAGTAEAVARRLLESGDL